MEFKTCCKYEKGNIWSGNEIILSVYLSSCSRASFLSLCPLSQLSQFGLLNSGRPQAEGREGGPTLAVWPEVALAALGCVDDHGAVPKAAIPPQSMGLVCAPLDLFLGITRANAEWEKHMKMSAMWKFLVFPLQTTVSDVHRIKTWLVKSAGMRPPPSLWFLAC